MWGAIGILMMQGRVEGDVSRNPMQGDWVELAARELGIVPQFRPLGQQGSLRASTKKLKVYLDLGAATQSCRRSAEAHGLFYLGLDLREWVYSLQDQAWMQNLVVDYTEMRPIELWDIVLREVRRATGWQGCIVLERLWISPPCHTYSGMNAINQARGCCYRVVGDLTKPPIPGSSWYAMEAIKSDSLVKHSVAIIDLFVSLFKVKWVLENPKGYLCQRPFMTGMLQLHNLILVDYCAFRGHYMKPTHLWTNLNFMPQGTTGCLQGRCCRACEKGAVGDSGRWSHANAIGQSSQQAVSGIGRRAAKEAVPHMLHEELMQSDSMDCDNTMT